MATDARMLRAIQQIFRSPAVRETLSRRLERDAGIDKDRTWGPGPEPRGKAQCQACGVWLSINDINRGLDRCAARRGNA